MRIIVVLFLSILTYQVSVAQTYKFGDIPDEHLEMEVYDKDSTARAVVLFSNGESRITFQRTKFELRVFRHVRIKILTDEGLDEGDISIGFRNKDSESPQIIKGIKAESYTFGENGKIIKESVGRRDRFEDKISDTYSEIKFTIPGLKKGSVLEYQYEIISDRPLDFPTWVFQRDIPVIWSEYNARVPEWFNFLTVYKGYHNYHISERTEYNDRITVPRTTQNRSSDNAWGSPRTSQSGPNTIDFVGTDHRFVMKDLPGIEDEPYMKASMDYLAHVRFQLESIQFFTILPDRYLSTWQEIVNELDEDVDFGKRLRSSTELSQGLAEAITDAETDLDKMINIYNHVANHMDWDENYRLYAFDDLKKSYVEGVGNSSEINLILIQMLREAGLEANPVILSTRFNGETINLFPIAGQFNHTIARVKIEDTFYLIDAKNDRRPYNILPYQVLNGNGLLIEKDNVTWIPLQNSVRNNSVKVINLNFSETGYSGSLESANQGFYALDNRDKLDFDDLVTSAEEELFEVPNTGFSVDSVSITNDKLDESFEFTANFHLTDSISNSIIYFDPMLMGKLVESPFIKPERTFPVDFEYPFSESIIMNITIPDGWTVDEIPQSVLIRIPAGAGEFRRIVKHTDNTISMNYRYRISKSRFVADEYEGLKQFYDQMVAMLAENIVLKKNS